MTWYAHEIICQPTPEILAELQAHPVLSQGMYWVRDLEGQTWFNPKAKHGLPPDGLLVMRPVCSPYKHEEWYAIESKYQHTIREPKPSVLSWYDINPTGTLIEMLKTELEAPHGPPEALKRYLQSLSERTKTITAFYQCEMWGGTVDWETAWVYTPQEIVYTHPANPPNDGKYLPEHDIQPLLSLLEHFGLELPTTHFALHTRGFPWAHYKLPAP